MSEEKERLRSASKSSLPQAVDVLDHSTFAELFLDLQRARELRVEISEREEELDELKGKLTAACEAYELAKGFRAGLIGFEYQGWTSRKTLNKDLLLEQGVTAEQIAKSMKEGQPFVAAKFVDFDLL